MPLHRPFDIDSKSDREVLFILLASQEIIMTAIADLNTAIAKLQTDVTTLIQMQAQSDQTPAIVQATSAVNALDETVTAVTAPPPPPAPVPPAPAPVPPA